MKKSDIKSTFFGIGIENGKNSINYGTLMRSAFAFGASFTFLIGRRFKYQCSDTVRTYTKIPHYQCKSLDDLPIPYGCPLVGVEIHKKAVDLRTFEHPKNCIYLLGAEDNGLSDSALKKCHRLVYIDTKFCLNVSTAGTVVMYDRSTKVK